MSNHTVESASDNYAFLFHKSQMAINPDRDWQHWPIDSECGRAIDAILYSATNLIHSTPNACEGYHQTIAIGAIHECDVVAYS